VFTRKRLTIKGPKKRGNPRIREDIGKGHKRPGVYWGGGINTKNMREKYVKKKKKDQK